MANMPDWRRDGESHLLLAPFAIGRAAFYDGRQLYGNPFIDLQAAEWRKGWLAAQATFQAAGGKTDEDRVRLRPVDLPKSSTRRTKLSQSGMWRKAKRMRQQGKGWRG